MDNVEKLQEQIKALLDTATDKEQIASLGAINDTIEAIKTDTTALKTENRELLNDYKDLVKASAFKTQKDVEPRGQQEAPNIEDFLMDAMNNSK